MVHRDTNMGELSSDDLFRVNDLGERFESRWRLGQEPRIEEFLGMVPERLRDVLLQHLIGIELELLREGTHVPSRDNYERRFPEDRATIAGAFSEDPESDHGAQRARN